jgi:phosphatidylserine/phosphatidylglycerophosphate/cardiolipin synthase-like enzyme
MSDSTKTILIGTAIFLITCLVVAVIGFVLLMPKPQAAQAPATGGLTTGNGEQAGAAWYQIYFTSPRYPDKAGDHHGSVDERLAGFIDTAKTNVDIAIYQLDLDNVTQALINAKKRGATVRVVTDIDILNDPKENPSFKQLEKAGIRVVGGNPNGIMHNKFVVVDKAAVWTGSWNFTVNDTYRYNNNGILVSSPELARNYVATFEKMFNDQKFGPSRKPGGTTPRLIIGGVAVENYFAPEDKVADKILPRLKQAARTIDFIAFSFTDDDLGQAVLDRAKAGVKVRGVFEKTGSETQFSEFGKMQKAGLDVWQDGNAYLMHHKVFIVDSKTVILGSFNFSQNAEEENDENLLIVDDVSLAQQFQAEFGRVYDQARAVKR